MAVASLALPPDVEHVRTARLVAVAAARRVGLDEAQVDDVRLAVGEAVSRAVLREQAAGVADDVVVLVDGGEGILEVTVVDAAATGLDASTELGRALLLAVVPDAVVDGPRVVLRWAPAEPATT